MENLYQKSSDNWKFRFSKGIVISFIALLFTFVSTGNTYAQAGTTPVARLDNFYFDLRVLDHDATLPLNVLFNDSLLATYNIFNAGMIEIVKMPANSDLCVINQAPNQSWQCAYSPNPGFVGVDTLVYRLNNGGHFSEPVNVYIYVYEKPDAISSATCYTAPPPIDFEMEKVAYTDSLTQPVSAASPVLVGNLMGDTAPEIVVWGWVDNGSDPNDGKTNILRIFSYNENAPKGIGRLVQEDTILVRSGLTDFGPYVYQNVTIAKADNNDPYASIFVTTTTGILICFRYDSGGNVGATGGQFFREVWSARYLETTNLSGNSYASPIVASFSGDGNIQVQAFDRVFNATNGALLVSGGLYNKSTSRQNRNGYHFGQGAGHGRNSVGTIADVDNDGIQELVCGDCVYDITIGAPFTPSSPANQFVLKQRANLSGYHGTAPLDTVPNSVLGDGGVAIADINLDGKLDVVVTTRTTSGSIVGALYAYDPITGELLPDAFLMGNSVTGGNGPGMPMVGDLDGNGVPNIAYVTAQQLDAFEYENNKLVKKYTLNSADGVDDASASTALTIFDFGMRGKTQILYRAQRKLMIFDQNGSSLSKVSEFCSSSPTVDEYPVVADLSANSYGPAKIIYTGKDFPNCELSSVNNVRFRGSLYVVSAKTTPWAPARSVWNQNIYNPLTINDDMSIPVKPFSQATQINTVDGQILRPFNGSMYQLTSLNREGELLYATPDLNFDARQAQTFEYKQFLPGTPFNVNDSLIVNIHIQNTGTATFSNTLNFQLYKFQTSGQQYHLVKEDSLTNVTLEKYTIANYENGSMNIRFGLPGYNPAVESGFPYGSYTSDLGVKTAIPQGTWLVTINVGENGVERPMSFTHQDECNIENNFNHAVGFIQADRVLCYQEQTLVQLEPRDSYWCLWYSNDPNNPAVTQILDQADPAASGANAGDPYVPCDADGTTCASLIYGNERHTLSPGSNVYDPALATLRGQDHLTLSKNGTSAIATPRDTFYVMLYTGLPVEMGGTGVLVSPEAQRVVFHLSPESLKWTGGGSTSDWHNPGNWTYTGPRTGDDAPVREAWIPRACTNVTIPKASGEGGIAATIRYPDLNPKDALDEASLLTNYSVYTASCDTIHFEQFSEINRPDSLHYNSAQVDMELAGGRWYTLSPPLSKMYSGDYYLNNPNPLLDKIGNQEGMFFYMRNFGRLNPQNNKMEYGKWTGSFNTPDVLLPAGLGFGAWVDDPNNAVKNSGTYVFPFPKKEDNYYIWKSKTAFETGPYAVDRLSGSVYHGDRFIYEDAGFNKTTGQFTYTFTPTAVDTGGIVLIGNPFMAHINFDLFYERNQASIGNYFYTVDANGTVSSYVAGTPDNNAKYIPPMQGIFIKVNQNTDRVTFDVKDLAVTFAGTRTQNTLRSTEHRSPDTQKLVIEAGSLTESDKKSRAYLMLNEEGSKEYVQGEDVPRLFMEISSAKQVPAVYTRSSDGHLLEYNRLNGSSETVIPLGIRLQGTGTYQLSFKGSLLDPNEAIYLHDKKEGTEPLRLHKGAIYKFNVKAGDAGADLLIENRFYLTFNDQSNTLIDNIPTGIQGNNPLVVYSQDGAIHASMSNGETIVSAQVFDLMGCLVSNRESVHQPHVSMKVAQSQQVYILRVVTEKGIYSVKVK